MKYYDIENTESRMAVLRELSAGGHEQIGPGRNGPLVAFARVNGNTLDGYNDVVARLASRGLRPVTPGHWTFFPLGSDQPAERLRHDGSYPGSKGFHAYAEFEVAP